MRRITEDNVQAFINKLKTRSSTLSQEDAVQRSVRQIIKDVRQNGDHAVRRYTKRFDGINLKDILISQKDIEKAASQVENRVRSAMRISADRIRDFHTRQKESSWQFSRGGITTGQIIRPLERVGVYVPGGKAAYPSTVFMNVVPAQVAGVSEIALCVPTPQGVLDPCVACAIKDSGIREVYRIGGAQAVAALTYGTETIARVDKIVGPGNIFVAVAKKMVYGDVGIDMVAGPSEILIIADRSARPSHIAADLLSQAEHDEMASSVLITSSGVIAEKVKKELTHQMKSLGRKKIAQESIKQYGALIVVKSLRSAIDIANQIAPEHIEIMVKNPRGVAEKIKNAGAIFVGQWAPEPLGDYAAGPSHTLPTNGTSRFSSPLGVYDFIRRSSLIGASKAGFMRLADTVETFADVEGLEAHGNTVRVRRKSK